VTGQHRGPTSKWDQKAENAEKSRKYGAKDGAKLNGVRRCDGLQEPSFSGRRLGFCTISGPELVARQRSSGGSLVLLVGGGALRAGCPPKAADQRLAAAQSAQTQTQRSAKKEMQWQRGRSCSRAHPYRPSASPSRRCRLARRKPYATGASQLACGVPMRSRVRRRRNRRSSRGSPARPSSRISRRPQEA